MRELSTVNTVLSYTESIGVARGTRGTETSKYPEEKKTKVIPKVVASEIGEAQTSCSNTAGVLDRDVVSQSLVEWYGKANHSR